MDHAALQLIFWAGQRRDPESVDNAPHHPSERQGDHVTTFHLTLFAHNVCNLHEFMGCQAEGHLTCGTWILFQGLIGSVFLWGLISSMLPVSLNTTHCEIPDSTTRKEDAAFYFYWVLMMPFCVLWSQKSHRFLRRRIWPLRSNVFIARQKKIGKKENKRC